MQPLVQEFLITLIRKAMTVGATYLVTTGWLSPEEGDKFAAGFAILALSLAWSLWNRYRDRVAFLIALKSDPGTPEADVRSQVKSAPPGLILGILAIVALLFSQGCAMKSAPLLVAQTSLGLAQSIERVQIATEQLHRAGQLPTKDALAVQERLLVVNTRIGQVVPYLKAYDAMLRQGVKPTLAELDTLIDQIIQISSDLSLVVAGVPVSETTRFVLDMVRESQRLVATTLVEVARLRAALER